MLPSQLKRLNDTLRSQFAAIQEAIQKHTAATNQAGEASNEQWRQIPGIISTIIDAKDHIRSERAQREENERKAEQKPLIDSQERIAKWTKRACIAAALYGAVAFWQGCLMRRTLSEMEDQTYVSCLNAQATQKAFLQAKQAAIDAHGASVAAYTQALAAIENEKAFVSAQFVIPKDRPYGQPLELKLTLTNTGKSDANNVSIAGTVIAARPNSNPKIGKFSFSIQKDSLIVGETFLPDKYPGYTGPARTMRVPVLDERGKPIIDTAEIDREIFAQRKKYIFIYYQLSYEDFDNRYVGSHCDAQVSWQDGQAEPMKPGDVDRQCSNYNTKADAPKIPMPSPDKDFISIPPNPPITCIAPKRNFFDFR